MNSDKFDMIYKKSVKLYSLYLNYNFRINDYISSLYKKIAKLVFMILMIQ